MKFTKKNILFAASGIAVLLIFHICYGWQTLIPTNISWLMTVMHDWGTHYLGWHFYKNEAWHFPLGSVENYFYPVGTNVGFTDSIPLLAIFFKLFAPLLPEDFQYFGLWLFLCHLLAAWFTIRLCSLFKVDALCTFIAVIFVAANPVLIYRGLHPALCAHWLLVASVYVYFLNPSVNKKILHYQFILLMISALVNPYLCFMVLGFTGVTALKLCFFNKVLKRSHFWIYLAGSFASLLLVFYLVGLLGFGAKEQLSVEGGYGLYGLNLNALFNAQGFSAYLPQLKWVSAHQYEGFMYLGMGIFLLLLLLLVYGLFLLREKRRAKQSVRPVLSLRHVPLRPLIVLMALYTLFSISHVITLNDKILLKIPLPASLIGLFGIFRASARFFWTPYYLILFVAIIGVAKSRLATPLKVGILSVALLIQLADTRLVLTYRHLTYGSYEPPINNRYWSKLMKEFDDIVFYPPFQASNLTPMDYQYFCYLAAREKKPISTGYVARADYSAMQAYGDTLNAALAAGKLSPRTLYITTLSNLQYFTFALQTGAARLNLLDNYCYLYTSGRGDEVLSVLSDTVSNANRNRIDSALEKFSKKISFVKSVKKTQTDRDSLYYSIEKDRTGDNYLSVSGWAFISSSQTNKGDSTFLFLEGSQGFYTAPAILQARPDVTAYYKRQYLDDAGFNAIVTTENVEKGLYKLGIGIKTTKGKLVYHLTERQITIGVPTEEKISRLPPVGDIAHNAEVVTTDNTGITISGWAFFKNQHADGCEISLVFRKDDAAYYFDTEPVQRPDVTAAFKKLYKLDNSGFTARIPRGSVKQGNYQLGIVIKDNKRNRTAMIFTGREIQAP